MSGDHTTEPTAITVNAARSGYNGPITIAAIALAERGWEVSVHERRDNLAAEGYGIAIQRNMTQIFENFVKFISLTEIDKRWREHLSAMDQMREGINLRAYGQKNPLIEYKKEGFILFEEMMFYINKEILKNIFRTNLTKVDESKIIVESNIPKNMQLSHNKISGLNLPNPNKQKNTSVSVTNPTNKKYGRNDKIKISNGSDTKIIKFKKAENLINPYLNWDIDIADGFSHSYSEDYPLVLSIGSIYKLGQKHQILFQYDNIKIDDGDFFSFLP
mgnify:CR=1 FL=1